MLGGWRGRVIRGHLCGLQRQSSEHSGATQFTSMKNRCGPGTETRALTEKNRRGGRESARENKLDSRGRMRTVCVRARLMLLFSPSSGHTGSALHPTQRSGFHLFPAR